MYSDRRLECKYLTVSFVCRHCVPPRINSLTISRHSFLSEPSRSKSAGLRGQRKSLPLRRTAYAPPRRFAMGSGRKKAWLAALFDRAVAAVDVIDFRGQLRAERVYQALVLAAAAAGFAHGFATQSFAATFYWWLASSLLAGLLAVPGWPVLYRRDPVEWLKRLPTEEEEAKAEAAFEAEEAAAARRRGAGGSGSGSGAAGGRGATGGGASTGTAVRQQSEVGRAAATATA